MSDLHALDKQIKDSEAALRVTIASVGAMGASRVKIAMAQRHLARAAQLTWEAAKERQDEFNRRADKVR